MLGTSKIGRIEGGLILLVQKQFVEDKLSNSSRSLSNNRYDSLDQKVAIGCENGDSRVVRVENY
jgi:hypothetical protein